MTFLIVLCWIMGGGAALIVLLWILACILGPFLADDNAPESQW